MNIPTDDRQNVAAPGSAVAQRFRLAATILLAVILLAAAGIAASGWHKELSLEALVRHRATIEAAVTNHRIEALVGYMVLYAVAAGSSLPGVVLLTIGGGAIFGGLMGGFAAVAGASAGATITFLIAKSVLGSWIVQRTGPLAERFAGGFREDAFNYLLFMRLVPIFPFLLANLVAALCGVRIGIFLAATAIGITPTTLAFSFFGAGLDSVLAAQVAHYHACLSTGAADCRLDFDMGTALTPQFIAGLVALGMAALIPVAVRRLKAHRDNR